MSEMLPQYALPIVHLKWHLDHRSMGLVLGAGVSRPLGLPKWKDLVKDLQDYIAEQYPGSLTQIHGSLPYQSQVLFQMFERALLCDNEIRSLNEQERNIEVRVRWRRLIHSMLYKKLPNDESFQENLAAHPYLRTLTYVAKRSPLTVTYNFDDAIERILDEIREPEEREKTLPHQSIWSPRHKFRPDGQVIFHVNGFLPYNFDRRHSEELVFSETEFANKVYNTDSYENNFLVNHFGSTTCIFVGLSLNDASLKNQLRQASLLNPGHYNFLVYHINERTSELHDREKHAIYKTNFKLYNLITLFLDTDNLHSFLNLLLLDTDRFAQEIEPYIPWDRRTYYLVGPVCSGKSTIISYLRSFTTYEEWTEPRPVILHRRSDELNNEDENRADDWIDSQIDLKNKMLRRGEKCVHIMDRAPLDAFAFKKKDTWPHRAGEIIDRCCPQGRQLEQGGVILLEADPEELARRARARGQSGDADYFRRQQEDLKFVYSGTGCVVIDTRHLSIKEVVNRVAEHVFDCEYEPFDMQGRLEAIRERGSGFAEDSTDQ